MKDVKTKKVKLFGPIYHEFRIAKRIVNRDCGGETSTKELYVIERRTRIFNLIPLWWSTFYSRYAFRVMIFYKGQGYGSIREAAHEMRRILEHEQYITTRVKKAKVGPEDYI